MNTINGVSLGSLNAYFVKGAFSELSKIVSKDYIVNENPIGDGAQFLGGVRLDNRDISFRMIIDKQNIQALRDALYHNVDGLVMVHADGLGDKKFYIKSFSPLHKSYKYGEFSIVEITGILLPNG